MELWLKIATVLEYSVMIVLLGLSIWSIAIMIDRRRTLGTEAAAGAFKEAKSLILISKNDLAALSKWAAAGAGLHRAIVNEAIAHLGGGSSKIDRAVRSRLTEEKLRLEKGLSVLATLGANAPFIGLFGTVLGIIRSFAALGESSGAASSVMSGISQALVATAAGLFVAIPAVIAFNTFSQRLRVLIAESESLRDLMIANLVKGE